MSAAVIADRVAEGLAEIEVFAPGRVSHEPDGSGGAYITVEGIALGPSWTQDIAALTFHLPYNYPDAAPYPYYLPEGHMPSPGQVQAVQPVVWREQAAVQVSLRNNNWDPATDTALGCLLQVSDWLRRT